jgi:hypothetical protein
MFASARRASFVLAASALFALPFAASAQATPISAGQAVNGQLQTSDPVLADGSHYDLYAFRGVAGQQIRVTLRSGAFDAYLSGGRMDGSSFVAEVSDDDGAGGTDAQLTVTVGNSGSYVIRATSYEGSETGAYTIRVEQVAAGGGGGGAAGGPQNIAAGQTISGRLDASDPKLTDDSHYDLYVYRGQPGESIVVTMRSSDFDAYLAGGTLAGANLDQDDSDDDGAGGTDARLSVEVGPTGVYAIRANSLEGNTTGAYTLMVQSTSGGGNAGAGGVRTIRAGDVASGRLQASDPRLSDNSHYHSYRISGGAGEKFLITLTSDDFDAYLRWGRESGGSFESLDYDDDSAGGTNARLEVTLTTAGTYTIQANSYGADATGAYTLSVEGVGAGANLPQLRVGQPVRGSMTASDPVLSDNSHYKLYVYQGRPGEEVLVTLRSSAFDAYLHTGRMVGGAFESESTDDDGGGGTDSQILATVGSSGALTVQANTLRGGETGAFTLSVEPVGGARGGAGTGTTVPAGQRRVSAGERVQGNLRRGDPMLADSSYYNQYQYGGNPGDRVRITLRSGQFDAFLRWGRLNGTTFEVDDSDDDGAGGTDAQLDVTVAGTGVYAFQVNSYEGGQTGAYEVTLERLTGPATSETPPPSGGQGGKWIPAYLETTNTSWRSIGNRVKQQGVLEEISEALNTRFRMPKNIPIKLTECDEVNAFYSPSEGSISFCYEMLAYLANAFVRDGQWTQEQQEDVLGAVRFILMHEIGHALIDVFDLPVTGREEDVADQLAVVMLVEGGEKGANAALAGASALQPASDSFDDTDFADEHSLGPVRLFNVACWIYGSEPRKYQWMVAQNLLPEDRAVRCPSEFERMSKSWYRLLAPHTGGF